MGILVCRMTKGAPVYEQKKLRSSGKHWKCVLRMARCEPYFQARHFLRKEIGILNELQWNERFNIGIDKIDAAHQRLFSIVDKLIKLNEEEEKQQHACKEGIKYFKSYTLKHFAEEEAFMREIHYGRYPIHKSLHDNMRDNTIPALEYELEKQHYSVESVQHFLGICVGWLTGHIMIEDCAIMGKASNKWIHQTDENELESLEKAILQALKDLFRVNSELISARYGGEDFSSGNSLCYRLTYKSLTGEPPLQVFLAYEEQMILRILSMILGKQLARADKTVLYAMRILSEQFMDCIGKHFTITSGYELNKNDFLTFDQLVRTFHKEYPPYSMLFNVGGKGYMALCIKK
ncbi:MAG: hypothetical protein HDR71_02395 [Lachnospiraceae bacterium]|nr:hypothetical protein [Lachnospiraceae bacterium]